ncbi:MAG: glycine cleavage system protein GcvH [Azovibrio sp.]
MMNLPQNLKYKPSHEWVLIENDGSITVGITDHAQDLLGDLVFIELPQVGQTYKADEQAAVVESVKTASDVHAPVAGTIIAVNDAVRDAPETLNQNAYANWLFKMAPADKAELDILLDASGYKATVDAG